MNQKEILETIRSNNFDKFIGQIENDWLDFKISPYILKSNKQKVEFAKDISSFANSEGGFILIGFKTKKDGSKDKAVSLNPITKSSVDIKQYEDVINDWIFPKIGYHVDWKELDPVLNKGIIIIQVDKAKRSPFLVIKTMDEEKTINHFFGHFQRKGDRIVHFNIYEMYSLFQQGFFREKLNLSDTKLPEEIQEEADEMRTDDSLPEK